MFRAPHSPRRTAYSPSRRYRSSDYTNISVPSSNNEEEFKRQATALINELIRTAPSSWKTLFRSAGLPEIPSIQQLIDTLLEKTAGGNDPGPKGREVSGIPLDVRKDALKGVILSHKANYPSYNGIGLTRGIQLATQDSMPQREVNRMCAFFSRNRRYMDYPCFGNDDEMCKSWLAWLNWGGTPGRDFSCARKGTTN